LGASDKSRVVKADFTDVTRNDKLFIEHYWKVYRWIVGIVKILTILALIVFSLLIFAIIMESVFTKNYMQTLILTLVFVAMATAMNRLADHYGD